MIVSSARHDTATDANTSCCRCFDTNGMENRVRNEIAPCILYESGIRMSSQLNYWRLAKPQPAIFLITLDIIIIIII